MCSYPLCLIGFENNNRANKYTQKRKVTTITGDDVMAALEEMEFEEMITELEAFREGEYCNGCCGAWLASSSYECTLCLPSTHSICRLAKGCQEQKNAGQRQGQAQGRWCEQEANISVQEHTGEEEGKSGVGGGEQQQQQQRRDCHFREIKGYKRLVLVAEIYVYDLLLLSFVL